MLNNEIFLYVGCGNHRLDKFLHADICVFKQFKNGKDVGNPDLICDISENIPLKDLSCKFIYSIANIFFYSMFFCCIITNNNLFQIFTNFREYSFI